MTPAADAPRPQYARAAAWYAELYGTLRSAHAAAWLAATAAVLTALLLGLALMLVGPQRRVVGYAVPVDGLGGDAERVLSLAPGPLTADPTIAEAHAAQYVMAREGFAADDTLDAWRRVAAWSDRAVLDGYRAQLSAANPESPLAALPPGTTLEATVRSVSLLSPTSALVRFDTVRRDPGATSGLRQGWQSTIAFRWSDAPMRNADRRGNPLGFTVVSYRREPDGAPPQQVAFAAP